MDGRLFDRNYRGLKPEEEELVLEEILDIVESEIDVTEFDIMDLKALTKVAEHFVNDPEFVVDVSLAKTIYEWNIYGASVLTDNSLANHQEKRRQCVSNPEYFATHFLQHAKSLAFIITGNNFEKQLEGEVSEEEREIWRERTIDCVWNEMDLYAQTPKLKFDHLSHLYKVAQHHCNEFRKTTNETEKWVGEAYDLSLGIAKIAKDRGLINKYRYYLKLAENKAKYLSQELDENKWTKNNLAVAIKIAESYLDEAENEKAIEYYNSIEKRIKTSNIPIAQKSKLGVKVWKDAKEYTKNPALQTYFLDRIAIIYYKEFSRTKKRDKKLLRNSIRYRRMAADLIIENGIRGQRDIIDRLVGDCLDGQRIFGNANYKFKKIINAYQNNF